MGKFKLTSYSNNRGVESEGYWVAHESKGWMCIVVF